MFGVRINHLFDPRLLARSTTKTDPAQANAADIRKSWDNTLNPKSQGARVVDGNFWNSAKGVQSLLEKSQEQVVSSSWTENSMVLQVPSCCKSDCQ
jgi:hypothetical protein